MAEFCWHGYQPASAIPGAQFPKPTRVCIGVPPTAWEHGLGNRSFEWMHDQHKEFTPRDPSTHEKFNTYRFAGYKEKVVALLA
jgi:hypothetical protein